MERILQKINSFLNGPEASIFHEFHKPPYGGGNTFLLALEKELLKQGLDVGRNKANKNTEVILFNSYNFDFNKLTYLANKFHPKMVHRVDGPISVYRGKDQDIDKDIWKMNHDLADRTIFQSRYSYEKHMELGLEFKTPTIIPNASDPEIFHSRNRISAPDGNRKIKLVTTVWSDNPKKGGSLLSWLNEHLDHNRFEFTVSGRVKEEFEGPHIRPPVSSPELARLLREHDIYIAPSEDDPCSNSLIEALTCGLPAVYLRSGGHPELVKAGGEGFNTKEELLDAINKVSANFGHYQSMIRAPKLEEIAGEYLKVFNS